jgi:hypothetical protein
MNLRLRVLVAVTNTIARPLLWLIERWDAADTKLANQYANLYGDDDE